MYGTFGGKDEKYADSVGSPGSIPAGVYKLRHVYVGKPSKLNIHVVYTGSSINCETTRKKHILLPYYYIQ